MAHDDSGLLDMWEVPALIHHDEARVRQALLPQRRVGRRHDLVIVAPDDQRRQLDAVQPLLKIRIKPARLPAELRHRKAVPQHHVHLRLARRQRQDAVGKGLVVIEVAHRLLGPPDKVVAARHALDADAGRR